MQADGNNIDASWCAAYANPTAEDRHVHKMDLDNSIEKATVQYREQIQSDMAEINKGVGFGKDGKYSARFHGVGLCSWYSRRLFSVKRERTVRSDI